MSLSKAPISTDFFLSDSILLLKIVRKIKLFLVILNGSGKVFFKFRFQPLPIPNLRSMSLRLYSVRVGLPSAAQ